MSAADELPEIDREFLAEKEYSYSVEKHEGDLHLVITNFDIPQAYTPRTADLLIKLPAGYPNANLDMFWTSPDVKLLNGAWPDRADVHQTFGNRGWQRWSRHPQQAWRSGIDSLRTFIASVRMELNKGI